MPFAIIGQRQLEYRAVRGEAGRLPLVFLHEGLGCVALWRDFPDKVARRLGAPALIYSRLGYGQSDGLPAKRTPRFMHEEALEVLPRLFDQLRVERPLLIGHSDGASIALIHAARADRLVAGLVLMAPHVFVEDICVESIARVRESYFTTDLRARLWKHHTHVDDAFLGWADIWLDATFRDWSIAADVARITAPMLLIQGELDEYRTLAQIDAIAGRARGAITRLALPDCGHSPHRDQEAAVLEAIAEFTRCLDRAQ